MIDLSCSDEPQPSRRQHRGEWQSGQRFAAAVLDDGNLPAVVN
jgi:hypothetical protein